MGMSKAARLNETIYQSLKSALLFGGFKPGISVTLRGLAETLDVSPTPVREAVKRLVSERALEMNESRRVSVPTLNANSYADIRFARITIEPELAVKGLANAKTTGTIDTLLSRLIDTDDQMDEAIQIGDAVGYMTANYHFHFMLYEKADSPVLYHIAESLWLQMSPYLFAAFGRLGTQALIEDDFHKRMIESIKAQAYDRLHASTKEDILQGLHTFEAL